MDYTRFLEGPLTKAAFAFTSNLRNIESLPHIQFDNEEGRQAYANFLWERARGNYAELTQSDKMFIPAEYLLSMIDFT